MACLGRLQYCSLWVLSAKGAAMGTPQDNHQDVTLERGDHSSDATIESIKDVWVKPEITEFKPVTVARGISYRIGDGISNLC
jgi:hypothetical protein